MLAQSQTLQRQQHFYHSQPQYTSTINILPQTQSLPQSSHLQPQSQQWPSTPANTIPSPAQSHFSDVTTAASDIYSFGTDGPLFDFQPQHYKQFSSNSSPSPMQSEHSNNIWANGQLTPTSTTRAHHRESSLSSLGSAGPASPYPNSSTSNPQVAGDIYHEFSDYQQQQQQSSKPITPVHTPQETFLNSHYTNYYPNTNLAYNMAHEGLPRTNGNVELMPTREFKQEYNSHSGRPSISTVASHESPSTPPSYDSEERQRNGEISSSVDFWLNEYLRSHDTASYRNQPPKLDRTMTDVYADELYNPSFQITSAPLTSTTTPTIISPQNEVFMQRLQMANNQHISQTGQTPLTIPARERSPFRKGSPLAPTGNSFAGSRFGTASHQREQMKMENDRQALVQQLAHSSPEQNTPKTISPKDVNLIYQENDEDSSMPLFPPQQQQSPVVYRQQPSITHESSELDDTASQQSYNSMATSRRESSSAFSTSSQTTQQQGNFNFTPSSVPGAIRQLPQQYPFVPAARRQVNISTEQFTPALTSMESSNSDYTVEGEPLKKPAGATADTGTYTCTYHGCTLRFETPAKLQRHKREGHRNSASLAAGGGGGEDEGGMTSAALRNTQNGPHKCERINPSTGKPCNTIFSRPYDLTRHEDTIHNARKQKVRCHLCTEEKTFSRNDALTRHFRVCHPDHPELHKTRRRNGRD
jgi:26S proteasome regulatory subunit N4